MSGEPENLRVVGMDAGGTKTVGLLADGAGRVLTKARGPGANLLVHGELAVEKAVFQVLEDLDAPGPIDAFCIGIAGADRPGERELLTAMIRRLGLRGAVRVEHDAHIALVAGAPAGRGIVVIAGTGSISYGVGADGATARSGGWGYLLGDEGSAYWLGHAAVRAGIRASDGRGRPTILFDQVCAKLEVRDSPSLVAWFYDPDLSRYRVAELASLVEESAEAGDPTASALLDQAAHHLASAARAVARQLVFEGSYPVVLAGGAFKACPSLYDRVEAALELEQAEVTRLAVEPATGAVTLALERIAP